MDPAVAYLGDIVRRQRAGGFEVTEALFAGGEALPPHRHERAYVSCLLSGTYRERTAAGERDCALGTVIWHPPGEAHEDRFSPSGGHLLNVELPPGLLEDAGVRPAPAGAGRVARGGVPYAAALGLFRALSGAGPAAGDAALQLAALAPAAPEAGRPAWLRRAVELLHDRSDEPLGLADVAREAGVHPVHVARTFRRVLGCTVGQFLAGVRLRRAFDLLAEPGRTVTEAAAACGFADHPHLARRFREATGLTPSQYRAVRMGRVRAPSRRG
ncbi:transcriptional regulator, AraC family [Anaeromyxobacter sp. K]|nr:transcriptional regulator, AraC family [Anaeromyxobacter sp. K]